MKPLDDVGKLLMECLVWPYCCCSISTNADSMKRSRRRQRYLVIRGPVATGQDAATYKDYPSRAALGLASDWCKRH